MADLDRIVELAKAANAPPDQFLAVKGLWKPTPAKETPKPPATGSGLRRAFDLEKTSTVALPRRYRRAAARRR